MFSSGYNLTFAVKYANSSLVMVTFDHQSLHFCKTLALRVEFLLTSLVIMMMVIIVIDSAVITAAAAAVVMRGEHSDDGRMMKIVLILC